MNHGGGTGRRTIVNLGDMMELADIKDLKSFDTLCREGATPSIPIPLELLQKLIKNSEQK